MIIECTNKTSSSWVSCQVRKIAGCACAGNAGIASDPDMHHARDACALIHAGWPTGGVLCSRWRGKRSQHSRRMHNPQFYVSGRRPIIISVMDSWFDKQYWLVIIWNLWEHSSIKFNSTCNGFHTGKCIWKYLLRDGDRFAHRVLCNLAV